MIYLVQNSVTQQGHPKQSESVKEKGRQREKHNLHFLQKTVNFTFFYLLRKHDVPIYWAAKKTDDPFSSREKHSALSSTRSSSGISQHHTLFIVPLKLSHLSFFSDRSCFHAAELSKGSRQVPVA